VLAELRADVDNDGETIKTDARLRRGLDGGVCQLCPLSGGKEVIQSKRRIETKAACILGLYVLVANQLIVR
jgi:hypothetical protein